MVAEVLACEGSHPGSSTVYAATPSSQLGVQCDGRVRDMGVGFLTHPAPSLMAWAAAYSQPTELPCGPNFGVKYPRIGQAAEDVR